jgi:predicted dehydrogenase
MADLQPLRAAIVGAGLMGRWHADAARRSGARITLVSDADSARAESLARKFGARSTTHLADALSLDAADVVHVCVPGEEHEGVVRSALAAKLHVLVEKPLAPTAVATAELYSLASSNEVQLCPVHQFLFQTGIMHLLEWRESIGPLRQLAAVICSAGADGADDRTHDGLAFDILPHPLSLASGTLPRGLAGARWHASRSSAGEIQAVCAVDGIAIAILISTHGRPTRNSFRVTGDRGTLHADLFHGFAFQEGGVVSRFSKLARPFAVAGSTFVSAAENAAKRAIRQESAFPGLRELVHRFYASVRFGDAPPVGIADALDVAAARDTIIAGLRANGALA